MAYFDSPNIIIATIVVIILSLLIIGLFIGWFYGARRLNLDLHHIAVYGATILVFLIILLWMGPRIISVLTSSSSSYYSSSPSIGSIIHAIAGLIVLIAMLVVSIAFIIKRDIPLALLKKMRYFMIGILVIFPIVFVLGILNYTKYF